MQETWVQSFNQEDPLGEENGNPLHYPGLGNPMERRAHGQSMGSQRVRCNLATKQQMVATASNQAPLFFNIQKFGFTTWWELPTFYSHHCVSDLPHSSIHSLLRICLFSLKRQQHPVFVRLAQCHIQISSQVEIISEILESCFKGVSFIWPTSLKTALEMWSPGSWEQGNQPSSSPQADVGFSELYTELQKQEWKTDIPS